MQYAVLLSSIVSLASIILSQPSTLGLQPRIYSTPSHGSMPLDCVATPDFSFHRFASNWTAGSQEELATELFSPAPVHRSHPFAFTIKPEPATVILRPVVLALPTGRADGRIYRFTKPLELQHFPWARRNAHVVAIECSAAHDRRNDTVHSYLQRVQVFWHTGCKSGGRPILATSCEISLRYTLPHGPAYGS